jgi:hypothetical protein
MSRKKQDAGGKPPEPADDHDRKLLADVGRHGWHVIAVEGDEEGPAFACSIGLHDPFGHPEVILLGLPVRVMHQVINGVGEQVRAGKRFGHRDESGDVLDGFNVCFRTVERRHYREDLGYAGWFYRGDDFPSLQCVWPDSRHRHPWHPEAGSDFLRRQPVLSDDTSWPFHEGKNRAAFTTRPVLEDNLPILIVSHDDDGDWQFLCGTTNRPQDGQLVSLGRIFERDRTLAEVADLPEGWGASRTAKGAAWMREKAKGERRSRKG